MSYLSITASDLSDRVLADFLDMDSSQIVTIHVQSVDQTKAIKTVKRTITDWTVQRSRNRKRRSVPDMIWISFRLISPLMGRMRKRF